MHVFYFNNIQMHPDAELHFPPRLYFQFIIKLSFVTSSRYTFILN